MKYTATLAEVIIVNVKGSGQVAIGIIEGDKLNRFPDGAKIRTSLIEKVSVDEIKTLNSIYKIVSWGKLDGR